MMLFIYCQNSYHEYTYQEVGIKEVHPDNIDENNTVYQRFLKLQYKGHDEPTQMPTEQVEKSQYSIVLESFHRILQNFKPQKGLFFHKQEYTDAIEQIKYLLTSNQEYVEVLKYATKDINHFLACVWVLTIVEIDQSLADTHNQNRFCWENNCEFSPCVIKKKYKILNELNKTHKNNKHLSDFLIETNTSHRLEQANIDDDMLEKARFVTLYNFTGDIFVTQQEQADCDKYIRKYFDGVKIAPITKAIDLTLQVEHSWKLMEEFFLRNGDFKQMFYEFSRSLKSLVRDNIIEYNCKYHQNVNIQELNRTISQQENIVGSVITGLLSDITFGFLQSLAKDMTDLIKELKIIKTEIKQQFNKGTIKPEHQYEVEPSKKINAIKKNTIKQLDYKISILNSRVARCNKYHTHYVNWNNIGKNSKSKQNTKSSIYNKKVLLLPLVAIGGVGAARLHRKRINPQDVEEQIVDHNSNAGVDVHTTGDAILQNMNKQEQLSNGLTYDNDSHNA